MEKFTEREKFIFDNLFDDEHDRILDGESSYWSVEELESLRRKIDSVLR